MRLISNKKINEFRNKLQENKIDAALFLCKEPIHDVNIEYFTGFQQVKYYSFSCLLLSQDKMSLIVNPMEYDRAVREAKADEIIKISEQPLSKTLKEKLKPYSVIGIKEDIFPYSLYKKIKKPKLKFHDIGDYILEIRSVKEPEEIERIKEACNIADYGIEFIENNLSPNFKAKEFALELEQELRKRGAEGHGFPTILTSGKLSCDIHPTPGASDQKIQNGLGLIDFGAVYKGYCSDVTVPFIIGEISKEQEKIVKTVEQAYQKSVEAIKIGLPTWELHETANKIITENGFEFKHNLGHGLGLETHDMPYIRPKPKDKNELKKWKEVRLKENMVFTIEPGIYEPNIGGCRLENDVLITSKGPKILTNSKLIKI